jgi:hypothetical protein
VSVPIVDLWVAPFKCQGQSHPFGNVMPRATKRSDIFPLWPCVASVRLVRLIDVLCESRTHYRTAQVQRRQCMPRSSPPTSACFYLCYYVRKQFEIMCGGASLPSPLGLAIAMSHIFVRSWCGGQGQASNNA